MRRTTLLLLVASLAAAAGSCKPPKSRHPLGDPAQAKPDLRIVGAWAGHIVDDDELSWLHVVSKGAALVDLVLVGNDGAKGAVTLHYEAFPTALDGKSYLNLRRKAFKDEYGEKPEVEPDFIFVRYQVAKDGALTLWSMEDELVGKAIEKGELEGTIAGDDAVVTADTAKLAAWVRSADEVKLFRKLGVFRKVQAAATTRGAKY